MSDFSSENEKKGNKRMRIRLAKDSDIPEMVDLLAILFTVESDFNIDAQRQQSGLREALAAPSAHVWVAESSDRQVVGMFSMQVVVSTA